MKMWKLINLRRLSSLTNLLDTERVPRSWSSDQEVDTGPWQNM
jgi:hypothetical protein